MHTQWRLAAALASPSWAGAGRCLSRRTAAGARPNSQQVLDLRKWAVPVFPIEERSPLTSSHGPGAQPVVLLARTLGAELEQGAKQAQQGVASLPRVPLVLLNADNSVEVRGGGEDDMSIGLLPSGGALTAEQEQQQQRLLLGRWCRLVVNFGVEGTSVFLNDTCLLNTQAVSPLLAASNVVVEGDPRLAKAITQPMHPAFGGLVPSVSMAYAYDARLTTGKWVPNELGGPAFGSDLNGGKPLPVRLRVALRLAMLPAGEGEGGDREDAAERAAAADPSPEVIDADELEERAPHVSVHGAQRFAVAFELVDPLWRPVGCDLDAMAFLANAATGAPVETSVDEEEPPLAGAESGSSGGGREADARELRASLLRGSACLTLRLEKRVDDFDPCFRVCIAPAEKDYRCPFLLAYTAPLVPHEGQTLPRGMVRQRDGTYTFASSRPARLPRGVPAGPIGAVGLLYMQGPIDDDVTLRNDAEEVIAAARAGAHAFEERLLQRVLTNRQQQLVALVWAGNEYDPKTGAVCCDSGAGVGSMQMRLRAAQDATNGLKRTLTKLERLWVKALERGDRVDKHNQDTMQWIMSHQQNEESTLVLAAYKANATQQVLTEIEYIKSRSLLGFHDTEPTRYCSDINGVRVVGGGLARVSTLVAEAAKKTDPNERLMLLRLGRVRQLALWVATSDERVPLDKQPKRTADGEEVQGDAMPAADDISIERTARWIATNIVTLAASNHRIEADLASAAYLRAPQAGQRMVLKMMVEGFEDNTHLKRLIECVVERTCQSCYGHAMQQAQDVYRCGAELWDTCRAATEALGPSRDGRRPEAVPWRVARDVLKAVYQRTLKFKRPLSACDLAYLHRLVCYVDPVPHYAFIELLAFVFPMMRILENSVVARAWDSTNPTFIAGFFTKPEAEALLLGQLGGRPAQPGTFLVRVAATGLWPDPFAVQLIVSYMGPDKAILHRAISDQAMHAFRLESFQKLIVTSVPHRLSGLYQLPHIAPGGTKAISQKDVAHMLGGLSDDDLDMCLTVLKKEEAARPTADTAAAAAEAARQQQRDGAAPEGTAAVAPAAAAVVVN